MSPNKFKMNIKICNISFVLLPNWDFVMHLGALVDCEPNFFLTSEIL